MALASHKQEVVPVSPDRELSNHERVCDGQLLHALLQEQTEVTRLLLDAAQQKRDALLERDTARIESAVAYEAELAERLQALEDQRAAWVADWAAAQRGGGEEQALTLSDVLSRLSADQAEPIRQTAAALAQAALELERINQLNADLVYYSLAHVQTLLSALAGEGETGGLYGPHAQKGDAPPRALVDWRV